MIKILVIALILSFTTCHFTSFEYINENQEENQVKKIRQIEPTYFWKDIRNYFSLNCESMKRIKFWSYECLSWKKEINIKDKTIIKSLERIFDFCYHDFSNENLVKDKKEIIVEWHSCYVHSWKQLIWIWLIPEWTEIGGKFN